MDDLSAQRTLVKSPPELWAEISDIESLARRLGEFGEIRITQLEPETTVAWEGDRIRGTVTLKPSGWGTKVTLAAELDEIIVAVEEPVVVEEVAFVEEVVVEEDEPVVEAAPEVEPEAEAVVEAEPEDEPEPVKVGFWKRLFGRKAAVAEEPEPEAVVPEPEPVVDPEPEPEPEPVLVVEPEPEPEPEPVVVEPEPEPVMDGAAAQAVLVKVLDDLGAAHHRPFSRG